MKQSNKQKKIIIYVLSVSIVVLLSAFWITFAFIEVNSSSTREYRTYKGTQLIAENGDCKTHLKNSLKAFLSSAQDAKFNGIKTEIRQTADGIWVCSDTDTPFKNHSVKISQINYETAKKLPLDNSAISADASEAVFLTSLEEFLSICSEYYKTAIIEPQGTFSNESLISVTENAIEFYSNEKVIFMSADLNVIKTIKSKNSFIKTLITASSNIEAFCYAQMKYSVTIPEKRLSEKIVKRIHNNYNYVCVLNVPKLTDYNKYSSLYVDYVIVKTDN